LFSGKPSSAYRKGFGRATQLFPGGQRGFDYFYGFLGGETNFFFPARLMLGNTLLPIDTYADDYYTTDDWTDKAIGFVREVRTAAPALSAPARPGDHSSGHTTRRL
jgi:hypothetical protein